jgi:hypothetical protein
VTATAQPREPAGGRFDRIDPDRSACVLIGVDAYTGLHPLPSVRKNLSALSDVLADRNIWGIPEERLTCVPSPTTPRALMGPIRAAAHLAEDTLIVYYAGHGLLNGNDDELLLTLPDSVDEQPDTCVRAMDVKSAIGKCSARRRVLILDCCYSGQMVSEMSTDDRGARGGSVAVDTLRGVRGSYVMASAPRDRRSHAPDPKSCTRFTGALADVLREGIPDGPEMLSLRDVFVAAKERVTDGGEAPEPQDQDRNDVGTLAFVRNTAVLPELPPPAEPVPGRSAHTLRRSLAAGVTGLVLGLGFAPGLGWWQRAFPADAGGACSPRAELLDVSDALDKKQVDLESVSDLSALALTSEGRTTALALSDNSPGRIFPLHLGSPFDLDPSPTTAKTLRHSDGSRFEEFDGEALVLEKGGRTALVGSETGPSIRRFDLTTGRQIGEALPMPKELRLWPEGASQAGRTVESLTVSPDGRYLYAGWEGPLSKDGDHRGRNILRIQRYRGSPGSAYEPDRQYVFQPEAGLNLADLVALGDERLLALERQYTEGLGNAVRVVELSLSGARDVTGEESLHRLAADGFAKSTPVLDLADCPAGGPGAVPTPASRQSTALMGNAEGMALGKEWTEGRYKEWRPLYLITDDNNSDKQNTRVYALALRL